MMSSFTDRLSNVACTTLVGPTVSLASEHGIFQTLQDAGKPITSAQVAEAKGLKERYVREVLGALATAELVHVTQDDGGTLFYSLEEGANKALEESTLGCFIRYPGLLARLYPAISGLFPKDGPQGIRYNGDVQHQFDQLAVLASPKFTQAFLDSMPSLKSRLEQGIDVLEFGAGKGRLVAHLAAQFPNSHFTGSDAIPALAEDNKKTWAHLQNLSWSTDDVCAMPEVPTKTYDWVFCNDVVHDLPDPPKALRAIRNLIRPPGGFFSLLDVNTAGNPVADKGNMLVAAYYSASTFLCVPESYQGGESMALGACWGKQTALNMIRAAGFDVKEYQVDHIHIIYVCTATQAVS